VKYFVRFITKILDDVDVVSEAAIKALEPVTTSEIIKLIQEKQKEQKAKKWKGQTKAHISNIRFGETEKSGPCERLMNRLRDQQNNNTPPYGF